MKPIPSVPGSDADFLLERFLPYRLAVLSYRVSRSFARLYAARFGLTIAEWRVMAVLGRFAPLSPGGLVERTAMDKVRVSRAVAALEAQGRIVRTVDSGDRRRATLRLSAEGRRIHAAIVPLARDIEARFMSRLDPAEAAILDALLARLQGQADQLDRELDAVRPPRGSATASARSPRRRRRSPAPPRA